MLFFAEQLPKRVRAQVIPKLRACSPLCSLSRCARCIITSLALSFNKDRSLGESSSDIGVAGLFASSSSFLIAQPSFLLANSDILFREQRIGARTIT